MRNINLRYVNEAYDEDGVLSSFEVSCPASFNFGYDVVDDIAANDPTAAPWCGATPRARTTCSRSPI